jgi:hypothetical protein
MSAARDPTSRLRAGLNPLLTTSLGVYHNPNTPLSAVSMTSQHALSAASHTPASAIQPYNPQEWIGSPVAGPGEQRHHFPPEPQGKNSRSPRPCRRPVLTLVSFSAAAAAVLTTASAAGQHGVRIRRRRCQYVGC